MTDDEHDWNLHALNPDGYLSSAWDTGDAATFAASLGDIAYASDFNRVARDIGMSQENLHRVLYLDEAPSLEVVFKVLQVLGIEVAFHTGARSNTQEYRDFLRRKVERARASMRAGLYITQEEIEAEAIERQADLLRKSNNSE